MGALYPPLVLLSFLVTVLSVDVTPLKANEAITGGVQPKSYAYYSIQAQGDKKDLTIATTPLTGDPDLYISTQVGS